MSLIRLLPPELADKIAAGEVVERPASVVKELVENSLDAKAGRIEVAFSGGGLAEMKVLDDGQGMSPDDARLAVKRHATSKITNEMDLFRVCSFGFRGEALPAIASVAKMTLLSRTAEAELAFRIDLEGGRVLGEDQVGGAVGTTVQVRELFYNTPARLKFLKTHRTEAAWIKEALIRLALPQPGVHFQLGQEGRTVLLLPAVGSLEDRLAAIFGPEQAGRMLPLSESHPAVRVSGWLSPPEETRPDSRSLYSFVNHRFVRDRLIMAALQAGFQGRLARGAYPAAAIFLEMEPGTVDVNVHPAKLEVRFHHAQAVRLAVFRAVAKALTSWESRATISLGPSPSAGPGQAASRLSPLPSSPLASPDRLGQRFPARPFRPTFWSESQPVSGPEQTQSRPEPAGEPLFDFRFLGLFGESYLVGQSGEDLVLIDQHAAHERLIYESLAEPGGQRQPLLLPERISLSPLEAQSLLENLAQAEAFGLEVVPEDDSAQVFLVRAVPVFLADVDPAGLVRELAEDLTDLSPEEPRERIRRRLAALACRAAIKSGQSLDPLEVDRLIQGLRRLEGPLTCPHGRPIIKRLARREIDLGFGRR